MLVAYVILLNICIIFIYLVSSYEVINTKCNYKPLNASEIYTGNAIHPTLLRTKYLRYSYSNIRIHFEYSTTFLDYTDSSKILKEIMEPAKQRLESILKVKNPLNGALKVNRACSTNSVYFNEKKEMACAHGCTENKCAGYKVPEKFLNKCLEYKNKQFVFTGKEGAGVLGADIALLVEVDTCANREIAAATACYLEAELDRPILGVIILCRGIVKAGENVFRHRLTVQHEIIHALGFGSDKFAYFRYQDGTPIVKRDPYNFPNIGHNASMSAFVWNSYIAKHFNRKRSSVTLSYTLPVFALTLPTVLKVARKHFDCPVLDGVDLDPYPVLSHFSEYAFGKEIMTPISEGGADELSTLTLSLLKDTGWYDANFHLADEYTYGKETGCKLILEGCYKYMQDQKAHKKSIEPFCDVAFSFGKIYKCSSNRKYFEFCNLVNFKSLDKKYQYFRGYNTRAGSSSEKEFCPVMQVLEMSRSICKDSYSHRTKGGYDLIESYYGPDSTCFEYDLIDQDSRALYGASCHKLEVDRKDGYYTVYFGDKKIHCSSTKEVVFVTQNNVWIKFICQPLTALLKLAGTLPDRIWRLLLLCYISLYVCI